MSSFTQTDPIQTDEVQATEKMVSFFTKPTQSSF